MILYDQLIPHDPDNGKYGDCFRAVVASLLQNPIETVPHFMRDNPSIEVFINRTTTFFFSKGLLFLNLNPFDIKEFKKNNGMDFPIYHEICDRSPRFPTEYHSVLGLDGEVFHDPHPTKLGLPILTEARTFGFLLKLTGVL